MNERVYQHFGVKQGDPMWSDWRWQFRNRISSVAELSQVVSLDEQAKQDIQACLDIFRMAITPYYASLMDPDNASCPIRMQAIPTLQETYKYPWEMRDPLHEDSDSPVRNIIHRYPDRVLFLVTRQCATYCRHCTRRRTTGEEDFRISGPELDEALGYIEQHSAIRDVLVSGGDPLTMGDSSIESIIARLRAIKHVEIIRIGTRVPVVLPMRVTPELLTMLRRYQPIWINTHFNHPRELTPEAISACAAIVDAGIPLGNQSVLLRNINDRTETMKTLLLQLVKARVRPYYLYQCDLSEGLEHFRTRVESGIEIIRELTGSISGYAIPRLVIDAPNGGGKVPLNPDYVMSMDDEQVVLKNYQGKIYTYPQPREHISDC
jgi:lysine 2,3-aminomutase